MVSRSARIDCHMINVTHYIHVDLRGYRVSQTCMGKNKRQWSQVANEGRQ